MILYDKDNQRYHATKCKRPKINVKQTYRYYFEAVDKKIDGEGISMWYQPAYGKAFYFAIAGAWYRLSFYAVPWKNINDPFDVLEFFTTAREQL